MIENGAIVGGICLLLIALVVAWWLVGGLILMVAWNAFLTPLFGLPALAYWQGVAGVVLLSVIGGAFRSNSYSSK